MVDLKLIHQVQLGILANVAAINSKYHLEYFLTGGSAIGAVRHHGFIPWDDDIDIGLPRTDFEKFLQVAPAELSHRGYFVEENRLDPQYEYDFAKVMADGTRILEHGRELTKAKNGIFIDVFPFDRMPNKRPQQEKQQAKLAMLLEEIRKRFYPDLYQQSITQSKYADYNLSELYDIRLSTMTQYNGHSELPLINMSSPYQYGKELIKPTEIHHLIPMAFENLQVPVLADYDAYLTRLYLTRLYGDYMKLPPLNKRIQRHVLKVRVDNYQTNTQVESGNSLEEAVS